MMVMMMMIMTMMICSFDTVYPLENGAHKREHRVIVVRRHERRSSVDLLNFTHFHDSLYTRSQRGMLVYRCVFRLLLKLQSPQGA